MEKIDLTKVRFTPELLQLIPAEVARRYRALPVLDSPRGLRLALADAADLDVIDSLTHCLRQDLELCIAEAHQLNEFIDRFYAKDEK